MKKIVMPTTIDQIKQSINYCEAYLIGINNLSVNVSLCVDIDNLSEIKEIVGDRELFISLNKNMFNNDLDLLRSVMTKLNDYNIKGVFYYDVGVLNIYNSISANYDLVWASNHASTNYNTINYWYNMGVNYCLLSSDITVSDIFEIGKNTKSKLIVPIFGYQSMFNSRRHIVKNYLDFFSLKDDSCINYMEKEDKVYPIIDDDNGTTVYTNYILNGIYEYSNLDSMGFDYCLFNSFNIDDNKFMEVLKLASNINCDNVINCFEKINSMFDNTDTGFFYKDTVTRVKKNEK